MEYQVEVRIVPRTGILDPQGEAVQNALHALGFESVEDVHVGRLVTLHLQAGSADEARNKASEMCAQLLANPVTEDFDIRIEEMSGSAV